MSRPGSTGGRAAVAGTVLGLVLAGCVTPATGSDSYRDKAVTAVRAATSEVATSRLTVRLLLRHDVLPTYADETVTANENALGSISASFGSVQPPSGDDQVRTDVMTVLGDAEDAVAAARVATRRSDRRGLTEARAELRTVARDLTRAEKALS